MPFSSISPRQPDDGSLRVLTCNIFGVQADWERRRQVLKPGLLELQLDLMALQETTLSSDSDQVADLLNGDYEIAHSRQRGKDQVGIAIASRWPLVWVEELDLNVTERTDEFACTTMIARIDVPAPVGPLLFVNHFPDYQPNHEHERELQTVLAARRLESLVQESELHVVIAGDLDAEPDAASVRFLTGKQSLEGMSVCYRNAWDSVHPGEAGHTFTPRNPLMAGGTRDWPFRRIDHILVRCGVHGWPTLDIAGCELAFDQAIDGIWGSDHIAVVADLQVP
jgi:endonuclease/exonuclease/phosphatase family metal-dependent hydrolase